MFQFISESYLNRTMAMLLVVPMMHGYGDALQPKEASLDLMQDMVFDFISTLVRLRLYALFIFSFCMLAGLRMTDMRYLYARPRLLMHSS